MVSHRQGRRQERQEGLGAKLAGLSLALLLLVIAAGLAACGLGSGGAGNPTPTRPASNQLQKCGTVLIKPRGEPADPTGAKQAADCFWQAFQQCHLASLVFTASGVDTLATHTFTIQNNGARCSVVDVMQHQIVPQPPTAARTYTCGGVSQEANGLRFTACGPEGDIVVPTTALTK